MFKQGDTVRIADIKATKNDDLMDKEALEIKAVKASYHNS